MSYQIEKTDLTVTLSPQELVFHNGDQIHNASDTVIPTKSVCCFMINDEKPNFLNLFVLIDKTENHILAVIPRIREIAGQIVLGQDNTIDNECVTPLEEQFIAEYNLECTCRTFQCYCHRSKAYYKLFAETFVPSNNFTYLVVKIPIQRPDHVFYCILNKIYNELDKPFNIYNENLEI